MGTDRLCIDTLRMLSVDAVEKARSGHPGLPLGAAPMAYCLWDRFLRHNPHNPKWFNRDRFILSAGHGSALLYALLHTYGYDLSIEELKMFRQWGSKTPGHPEFGETPGVEATTGPLGQGFAMGVGMAIAERYLAALFNRPNFAIVDHFTYAIVSDGDLMEGIAAEAASLAGNLGLGKLIYLYDDNQISIEGDTDITFTEDVAQRFRAYQWHVVHVDDGNDLEAIAAAIESAQKKVEQPSLIVIQTHIGYASPKQDTASAHGEPLGEEAMRQTRENLQWHYSPFSIPPEAHSHFQKAVAKGAEQEAQWQSLMDKYRQEYPDLAAKFAQARVGTGADWEKNWPAFSPNGGEMATRSASGKVLNCIAQKLPTFIGGSADLAPSNKSLIDGSENFSRHTPHGRNLRFGVREHAMAAIVNGMGLHGGIIPYSATFLVFSDYMRPALRLGALMQMKAIYIFSHDSICLGEDGPTHQPVEHLMSLRTIPGLTLLRPADANETVAAWRLAVERRGPVALVLTRQNLPILDLGKYPIQQGVPRGAYVLSKASATPQIILVASGSEVHLALAAQQELEEKAIATQVVSIPSWEIFAEQSPGYRETVVPSGVPKLSIEAGVSLGWQDILGTPAAAISVNRFGASAPWKTAYQNFGFTVDNVIEKALDLLK